MVCLTFKFNVFKKNYILNITARILTESNHITPLSILASCSLLHSVQNVSGYHGVAPGYLCELINNHHAVRALCSNAIMLLDEPKIRSKT